MAASVKVKLICSDNRRPLDQFSFAPNSLDVAVAEGSLRK